MSRYSSFIIALLVTLLISACGTTPDVTTEAVEEITVTEEVTEEPTDIPETAPPPTEEASPAPSPTPTPLFSGEGPWSVSFPSDGDVMLQGTLYGEGQEGVVLASMYVEDQTVWESFAMTLAEQGVRVLTFDYRGVGASEGNANVNDTPADVEAALTFMREHGFEPIAVVGAGLGGTAVLRAAAEAEAFPPVAIISAPRVFQGLEVRDSDLSGLAVPSLWVGTRTDLLHDIEAMYDEADGEKSLWMYEGSSLHGAYILTGADGADLERRLIAFIMGEPLD